MYRSHEVADPDRMPDEDLQCYLVFYKRHGKTFCIWIDGYDEYAFIDRREEVRGKYLTDERFKEVQAVMTAEWEARPR